MASQPVAHPDDATEWINRVKEVVAKPDILKAPPPPGAAPFHEPFFGCFDPIDTCTVTCY
jgi:hypothetical protein